MLQSFLQTCFNSYPSRSQLQPKCLAFKKQPCLNNKNNFLNQYQTTHIFVDFLKAYYCCNQFLDKKFACAYLHAPFNIIFISNFLPFLQVLASLLNAQLASSCCCSFSVLKNKLLLCRHYAHLCLTTTRRYIFELFLFRLL